MVEITGVVRPTEEELKAKKQESVTSSVLSDSNGGTAVGTGARGGILVLEDGVVTERFESREDQLPDPGREEFIRTSFDPSRLAPGEPSEAEQRAAQAEQARQDAEAERLRQLELDKIEAERIAELQRIEQLEASEEVKATRRRAAEAAAIRSRSKVTGVSEEVQLRRDIKKKKERIPVGETRFIRDDSGRVVGVEDPRAGVSREVPTRFFNERGALIGIEDAEQEASRIPTFAESVTGEVEPEPIFTPRESPQPKPKSVDVDTSDQSIIKNQISFFDAFNIADKRLDQKVKSFFVGGETFTMKEVFDPLRSRLGARESPQDPLALRIPSGTVDPTKEVDFFIRKGDIQQESTTQLLIKSGDIRTKELEKLTGEQQKLQERIDEKEITKEEATAQLKKLETASEDAIRIGTEKEAEKLTFFDFKTRKTPIAETIVREPIEFAGFITGISSKVSFDESELILKDGVIEPKLSTQAKVESLGPVLLAGGSLARVGRSIDVGAIEEAIALQEVKGATRFVKGKTVTDVIRTSGASDAAIVNIDTKTISSLVDKNTARALSQQEIAIQLRPFFSQKPITKIIRTESAGDISVGATTKEGVFAGLGQLEQRKVFEATLKQIEAPKISSKVALRIKKDDSISGTGELFEKRFIKPGLDDLKIEFFPSGKTETFRVAGISEEGLEGGKRVVRTIGGDVTDASLVKVNIKSDVQKGALNIKRQREITKALDVKFEGTGIKLDIKGLPETETGVTIIRGGRSGPSKPFTQPALQNVPEISTQVARQTSKSVKGLGTRTRTQTSVESGTIPTSQATTTTQTQTLFPDTIPAINLQSRIEDIQLPDVRTRTGVKQRGILDTDIDLRRLLTPRVKVDSVARIKESQKVAITPRVAQKQLQKQKVKQVTIPSLSPRTRVRVAREKIGLGLDIPKIFIPFDLKVKPLQPTPRRSLARKVPEQQFLVESFTARALKLPPLEFTEAQIPKALALQSQPFGIPRAPKLIPTPRRKRKRKSRKGGRR